MESKRLNSISTAMEHDATFVRVLLEILYKDNLQILVHRSFSGRSRKPIGSAENVCVNDIGSSQTEQFKAISPAKKSQISSLFNKRIDNINIPKQEKLARICSSNLRRLVSTGIGNLRKPKQRTH